MKWDIKASSGLDRLPSASVGSRRLPSQSPQPANCQLPTANCRGGCRGFTLVELLTVIAIAGILMTMIGLSLNQARNVARRTRAQAEMREIITAWLQYLQTYPDEKFWPGNMIDAEVNYELLEPLIAPEEDLETNPHQLMFLNVSLLEGQKYYDPWRKQAYRISFKRLTESELEAETAMRTSVSFPNRQRRWP